ncbi:MAG: GNAT family N-acetyltransferase [Acidimicrobiia bacterium]
MGIAVRDMTADEWPAWRDLRLRALRDDPDSFDEVYEESLAEPDEYWIEMLVPTADHPRAQLLLAELDGVLVGIAFSSVASDLEEHRLGAMYVTPEARGRGVGRAIAEHAVAWGSGFGVDRFELWVTEGNAAAVGLYRSLGYEPTETSRPLREGSDRIIREMRRPAREVPDEPVTR